MKLFVLAAALFLSSTLYSQYRFTEVKFGLVQNNIKQNPGFVGVNYSAGTGVAFGVGMGFFTRQGLFFGANLQYTQRNYSMNFSGFSDGPFRTNGHYASLPIRLGYRYGESFAVYGNLGVIPSYRLLVMQERIDYNGPNNSQSGISFHNESYENAKLEASYFFEIGLAYPVNDQFELFSEFNYYSGLTSFRAHDDWDFWRDQYKGIVINLGIRFLFEDLYWNK